MSCRNCKHDSHVTDDCKWLGQPQCNKCNWFGHTGADCRRQPKRKREEESGGKQKKAKKEQTNAAEEQVNLTNEISGAHIEEIVFHANDADSTATCNVFSARNNDAMILYEWLADCATTSHVTNMRDAFTSYTPLRKPVHGVGNAQTHAEGRELSKLS